MTLDPAIADMERRWKESGIPGLYEGGNGPVSRERASNIRALLYPKPRIDVGSITPARVPGPRGEIPVRIVRPRRAASGTVVYFHGGGWIVGDLDSHEAHCARIAEECGVVVVNVGYALAPEQPFPAAVEDAFAAVQWTRERLGELGGERAPLAVAGDSAGGNLAAVSALWCRDHGVPLSAQLLIYPATDLTRLEPSIRAAYFPERFDILSRDWRASPRHAPSLAGVAPAIIGVGSHDFLYADNTAYAAALRAAGVPVTLREYPTLNHGFFSYTAISEASRAAASELCADLEQALRR